MLFKWARQLGQSGKQYTLRNIPSDIHSILNIPPNRIDCIMNKLLKNKQKTYFSAQNNTDECECTELAQTSLWSAAFSKLSINSHQMQFISSQRKPWAMEWSLYWKFSVCPGQSNILNRFLDRLLYFLDYCPGLWMFPCPEYFPGLLGHANE